MALISGQTVLFPLVPLLSLRHPRLLEKSDAYQRDNDEQKHQGNGELKECLFHAPFGSPDGIGLTKDTAQAATPDLKQDG